MTGPLSLILSDWTSGRRDDAVARYGTVAAYIDFAMQDLDTVIDVGRAVTARVLDLDRGKTASAVRARRGIIRRGDRVLVRAMEESVSFRLSNHLENVTS